MREEDMRIAVLICGTFNPVTIAHIRLAELSLERFPGADVYFVPAKQEFLAGWKQLPAASILPAELRIRLLEAAIDGNPQLFVSTVEMDGTVDGRTIYTAEYFRRDYDRVYLIFGTDKVGELPIWHRSGELLSQYYFLIATRGSSLETVMTEATEQYRDHFEELRCDFPNVSATELRAAMAAGQWDAVQEMMPQKAYMVWKDMI